MPRKTPKLKPGPKKHHVIPAFYLAGFTETGLKTGRLKVFYYQAGKRYGSTPLKACRETDYNRIEEPGSDPNEIERSLSEVEGELAPSVRSVASGEVADRPAIAKTLKFAALCASRNRRARELVGPIIANNISSGLRNGKLPREEWERLRESELQNGVGPEDVPSYDDAIRQSNDRAWYPQVPTVLKVGVPLQLAPELYKALMRVRWETHVTDPATNGGFITSDNPLTWGDLSNGVRGIDDRTVRVRESLTDDGVEITFPVSKAVALVGHPDAREVRTQTTDAIVAHINARTLHISGRLIFHAYDDFLTEQQGGVIWPGSEYFAYVARARRLGSTP